MERSLNYKNKFDSIICDPPYGIRAKIQQSDQNQNNLKEFSNDILVGSKGKNCEIIIQRLFKLA